MQIHWEIKHFSELTAKEYHDLLKLRVEVFIIEQDCPYPEVDGLDTDCFHVIGKIAATNQVIATARIIPKHLVYKEFSIGRIVVSAQFRRNKIGSKLVSNCIEFIDKQNNNKKEPIRIGALKYLEHFYHNYKFKSIKEYREYDYDYVEMLRNE